LRLDNYRALSISWLQPPCCLYSLDAIYPEERSFGYVHHIESSDEDSSPYRPPRRGVTFRDTVETFPASGGRMERLRRLLNQEADEQRKRHTKDMRKTFQQQFKEIQQEQERERASQQKRKVPVRKYNQIVKTV